MGGPKAIRCRIEVAHGVKESPAVVLEPRDTYERVWLQLCRCLRGPVDRVLSRAAARDRQSAARGRFVHLAPLADSDGVHQHLCALAVCIRMGWRCKSGFPRLAAHCEVLLLCRNYVRVVQLSCLNDWLSMYAGDLCVESKVL